MKKHYFKANYTYLGHLKKRPKNAAHEVDVFDPEDAPYIIDIIDGVITVDEAAKVDGLAEESKKNQKKLATEAFDLALGLKLKENFDSVNIDRIFADRETWQDMILFPDDYAGLALTVRRVIKAADDSSLFGPGDLLNTPEKVTSFATRMLEISKEFNMWRIKEIDDYYQAIEDIENS